MFAKLFPFNTLLLLIFNAWLFTSCNSAKEQPLLDHMALSNTYLQEDAKWYEDNIPFFECSDKQIEEVYYYRWKMYKAHIRNTGQNQYVITEFINHVHWDRDPYCTINAASMHHIYEGRWLKDNRFMDGYLNNLYQGGGNNRSYSESVADAAYARYLVNGDQAFLVKQLDSMVYSYGKWNNHWDGSKQLYYIPAMPDATEYTVASIDATNGKEGFDHGEAFRPTINSYMYANALAIARIAAMKGDQALSATYLQKALDLKKRVEENLWNDSLQHFTDRYKQDNQYVHYWNFIRNRELAGMVPWYFSLPPDTKKYSAAWKHVLDTNYLLGPYGLRTNEPSYEYYFKDFGINGYVGSQWNGPSWPYQTSQIITGMANLLNHYQQHSVTNTDYLKLLRQFTLQHYLPNGKVNLVENYHPNKGGPIVYYYWSNHYNHSSYNNLIISGLCGIRPSTSDTLDLNPLLDSSIHYFYLDDIRYHGHRLSLIYDADGKKYNIGKGLFVFVDGKKAEVLSVNQHYKVYIGPNQPVPASKEPLNLALNITRKGFPQPSASINSNPDSSIYQVIDGRIWYFPEITNRWTTVGSTSKTDWYSVDFGSSKLVSAVDLYFITDQKEFALPDQISIEYKSGDQWLLVKELKQPAKIKAHTVSKFQFAAINTNSIRVNFTHNNQSIAFSEIECY